jgi:uncharacterized paraquat-inducible protein A
MAKTCNNCSEKNEKIQDLTVPYAVVELAEARHERQIKRMWIALIVAVALMFFTNMMWVGVFSSYDYSSEEVIIEADQDGEGVNIVGGGNVDYGAESEDNNPQEEAD